MNTFFRNMMTQNGNQPSGINWVATSWIGIFLILTGCSIQENAREKSLTAGTDQVWITSTDQSLLLNHQVIGRDSDTLSPQVVIRIDTGTTMQAVQGFGFSLTGGSAELIRRMDQQHRLALLTELFSPDELGVSYLRISMGASDLDAEVFSYDDLPEGATDSEMAYFSLGRDTVNLIPLLLEIMAIRPDLKIMASPWSAPIWMKTNGQSVGGSLKPEYYPSYAQYFVRYVTDMALHGLTIDAITIQNEPEHGGNNPSMVMTAAQQADFIKQDLGPAFRAEGINTKILIWDHNCDHPEYPLEILNDQEASLFVDGTAFHLYAGEVTALDRVHQAFPEKAIYFTEQWTGARGDFGGDLLWHIKNVLIGALQNWSSVVLEWNLASDPDFEPHTPGGCTECKGALTLDGDRITRNVSYYIIGQAARFIPPGSVRIGSSGGMGISQVAFRRPDGEIVLLVLNENEDAVSVKVVGGARPTTFLLPPKSAGTLVSQP